MNPSDRAKEIKARIESQARAFVGESQDPEAMAISRLAELWKSGEKGATIRIEWVTSGRSRRFCIKIRRADGTIEDPTIGCVPKVVP